MKKDPAGNKLPSPTITYHINSHTGLKPKTYFIYTYWTKANYAIGYNLLNNQISRGSEINTPISELIVINFAGKRSELLIKILKKQDHKIGPSIYGAVNKIAYIKSRG